MYNSCTYFWVTVGYFEFWTFKGRCILTGCVEHEGCEQITERKLSTESFAGVEVSDSFPDVSVLSSQCFVSV
jgi:hypothetical protein